MDITSLLAPGACVTVAVSLEDLRQFCRGVVAEAKRELEAEIAEDKSERYLSIKQACEMLGIDPSTLWRWKKRGYLTPAEVGGKRRYRLSEIRRMLNNGRAASHE